MRDPPRELAAPASFFSIGAWLMHTLTHIQRTIADLKHPTSFEAIPRIPIVRKEEVVGFLRPVPLELRGEASADARLMAEWRNLHRTAFFTWITSTEDSTRKWLAEKYGPDNENLIVMVETHDRVPFGHLALYNFHSDGTVCEFGRVLRGPNFGPEGGMNLASATLIHWAMAHLNVQRFFLEVFSDNHKAIALYNRLGFHCIDTLPLKRIVTGECIRWEKFNEGGGTAADGYALRMELRAEQLPALG